MARDDAPPFARGETFYNSGASASISLTDPLGLGGVNLEGKEFTFEVNAQDQGNGYPTGQDPSGRPIRVKVVRNSSGIALKPGRLARFLSATTSASPFECQVDGYVHLLTETVIAGVVDEFLPAAGVAPNDLFYVVFDGPTQVVTGATTSPTVTPGLALVPAAYGATSGDDLAGRVTLQDLTGATTPLADNIVNFIGFADGSAASTQTSFALPVVVHLRRW